MEIGVLIPNKSAKEVYFRQCGSTSTEDVTAILTVGSESRIYSFQVSLDKILFALNVSSFYYLI